MPRRGPPLTPASRSAPAGRRPTPSRPMREAPAGGRMSPPLPAGRASTTERRGGGVTDAEIAFPLLTVTGHARRSRVVTLLRVKKPGRRITSAGCFAATLLGLALIYGAGPADAADG